MLFSFYRTYYFSEYVLVFFVYFMSGLTVLLSLWLHNFFCLWLSLIVCLFLAVYTSTGYLTWLENFGSRHNRQDPCSASYYRRPDVGHNIIDGEIKFRWRNLSKKLGSVADESMHINKNINEKSDDDILDKFKTHRKLHRKGTAVNGFQSGLGLDRAERLDMDHLYINFVQYM